MSNTAIFLDRDDTLIDDPGYLSDPDQVKLLSGVAKALIEFKALGYKLVVVTNQSGIARGIFTEKVLSKVHDRLEYLLAEKNAYLDAIYYCPCHPDGSVTKFRKTSENRKPNPGMLLTAAKELDIDLAESWMIGNAPHDVEAGLRAGCKTILIDPPSHQKHVERGNPKPHYRAVNIIEAVNIVKKYRRGATSSAPSEPDPTDQIEPDQPAPKEPQVVTQEVEPIEHKPEPIVKDREPDVQKAEPIERPDPTNPAETPKPKNETSPAANETHSENTEQLLSQILDQLKSAQRSDMFDEFSTWRFMAGAMQGIVVLCLLITVYVLMMPERQNTSVLIGLGFAGVLQLMSLTFLAMQDSK